MKVKDLKKELNDIPDEYEIRSRAINAHLNNDEISWQLHFADEITKIKVVAVQKTVMLIRGFE